MSCGVCICSDCLSITLLYVCMSEMTGLFVWCSVLSGGKGLAGFHLENISGGVKSQYTPIKGARIFGGAAMFLSNDS